MQDNDIIEKAFIKRLKQFAAHGYAFDAGDTLRHGTRQDPNAKGTQCEAFDGYVKGFEEGHRHGYFEIPTGVGKTPLFTAVAKSFTDAVNGTEGGPRTLIVVPSEKLAVQTAKSFAKFMPEIAPTIETDDDSGKEIDWENSDIGLQYHKVKHAHLKPKILITTYQSLIRDHDNTTYPPKDYGLVIYDEGHAITAGQYGKVVEKFTNAIQLAVTATPEYSEEKTVAARLPNRYYGISIAEAINRGDLCNVRPVLLRTNYTIDKEKFKEYVEARGSKRLTDAQVTSLLNEHSRNRAAMETYLLGGDPDSDDRYLGQNGMIFCGTTEHVDHFTRQFNELLNKQIYKPVKEWLNEEDIELIAPVHGGIKGAYLKKGLLTGNVKHVTHYEGNKEWYSEDEIFDLHAKGKILLLASVKKLKEGYDSPRDSIIIDTIDRLSKVDATQIVGRGFRLNPLNKDFNDPGDPEKTCTVINMVDKNTYELYADKPQMLPIYCAEIIEGAEFRKPAKRKHLVQRFSKQPPEINTNLEASGFKLVTDIESVREAAARNKKEREKIPKLDKQPDGYWSSLKFGLEIQKTDPQVIKPTATGSAIIANIRNKHKAGKSAEYGGINIPIEAVKACIFANGKSGYAIRCEEAKQIIKARNVGEDKPLEAWSSTELAKAMGNSETTSRTILKNAQKGIPYLGVRIPQDAIFIFKQNAASEESVGVKKEWGKKLVERYKKIPEQTGQWTNRVDMAKLCDVGREDQKFNDLWNQIQSTYEDLPYAPVILDNHVVRCSWTLDSKKKLNFSIHASEASWIKEAIGNDYPFATNSDKTKHEFCEIVGVAPADEKFNSFYTNVLSMYEKNPKEPVIIDGHTLKCGYKLKQTKSRVIKVFHIDESEANWAKSYINPNAVKPDNYKGKAEFAKVLRIELFKGRWNDYSEKFDQLWKKMEANLDNKPENPLIIDGHEVHAMRAGKKRAFCVDIAEERWIREKIGRFQSINP